MANPRSNLDELMKDPKAAGLLKNKALLQSLMQSPDTQRLMELLSQNAGDGLKTAAAKGDTGALLGMVRHAGGVRQPRLHGRGHEMLPGGSGFRSPVPGERAQDHRGQV